MDNTLDRIGLTNLPEEKTERTFTAMVACLLRWLLSLAVAAVLWCYRCTELLPLRLDIAFALDCLRQELLPAGIALEDFLCNLLVPLSISLTLSRSLSVLFVSQQ